MVAPLIVGTAKVAQGASKTAARSTARRRPSSDPRSTPWRSAKPHTRSLRSQQEAAHNGVMPSEEYPELSQTQTQQGDGRAAVRSTADELQRKAQAVSASTLILWTALPFYIPQMLFWMVGLAGLGLETVPLIDAFAPGMEVFVLGYLVAAGIGACSMIYAAWVYTIRGVACFAGMKTFIFICCLTGYLVVFLNLFPWLVLWMLAVVLIKDEA